MTAEPTVSCRDAVTAALVVAMAGLLLGPALLEAREDARNKQCMMNLKQLGLAVYNYHDTYTVFPPGYVATDFDSATAGGNGWQTAILPFVDQRPLYERIDFGERSLEGKNRTIFETPVELYRCPLDALQEVNAARGGFGSSTYSGNAGHRSLNAGLPDAMATFWPGGTAPTKDALRPTPNARRPRNLEGVELGRWACTGLFAVNSSYRMRDIRDGTSNTFLMGERSVLGSGGIWPGVRSAGTPNDALTDCSHANRLGTIGGFSSLHDDVAVNMGFCDGTVRRVSTSIGSTPDSLPTENFGLLQRLANRNDALVIGEF